MRALLRDAQDQTRIALEVEEAVYDPKDNKLYFFWRLSCSLKRFFITSLPLSVPIRGIKHISFKETRIV